MKLLELKKAYDQGMVGINVKYIVSVEPIVTTNPMYSGDAKSLVYMVDGQNVHTVEDYETIMRMLVSI